MIESFGGIATSPSSKTDAEYIALARSDKVWCDVVASFAIDDMAVDEKTEVLMGRMFAGEISMEECKEIIIQRAKENN
jgi:hypothetical protein